MTGRPHPSTGQGRSLRRLRDERGSATAWALAVVLVMGLLAGTILDGGNAMAARVQAHDIGQQAARAGANHLDLIALRDRGAVAIDPVAAQAAAERFLAQAAVTGTVTATPDQVTVTVTRSHPTVILRAIGINTISLQVTVTAVPRTSP